MKFLERLVWIGDVRNDGVVLVVFQVNNGRFVGFLPRDKEEAVPDRFNTYRYCLGATTGAVWRNPGVGKTIVRSKEELNSKSLKVYQIAVSNRRK
jgi:hypothetical protein